MEKNECPVCRASAIKQADYNCDLVFYDCPFCGRFEIQIEKYTGHSELLSNPHLAAYLFYNSFNGKRQNEYRYHTERAQEICDRYEEDFKKGNIEHGHPVHMDKGMIEAWFPKTITERIDLILSYLFKYTKHLGIPIELSREETRRVLLVDLKEKQIIPWTDSAEVIWRKEDDCDQEVNYLLDYLMKQDYIEWTDALSKDNEEVKQITLTPSGVNRLDLNHNHSETERNVLVAMKFGKETAKLRERIREGINLAGYHAVYIDEVQHNDFITPELLKFIRDSRFVVVDLTYQNNGAYFEEGYAMGVGKEVIQLCRKNEHLHFDIAQKNTIFWEVEEEIPEQLKNRIIATID